MTITLKRNLLNHLGTPPHLPTPHEEVEALSDLTSWVGRRVFDPFAGTQACRKVLSRLGAVVLSNDVNSHWRCEVQEDALQPFPYHVASWKLGANYVIVTSPWFAHLDLCIPLMRQAAAVVVVQARHQSVAAVPWNCD